MTEIVPVEAIASRIYLLREMKVMLDRDLAELYGVEVRASARNNHPILLVFRPVFGVAARVT